MDYKTVQKVDLPGGDVAHIEILRTDEGRSVHSVYLNGLLQREDQDYSASPDGVLVLNAPSGKDAFIVSYDAGGQVIGNIEIEPLTDPVLLAEVNENVIGGAAPVEASRSKDEEEVNIL
jgi:hypothetical protein